MKKTILFGFLFTMLIAGSLFYPFSPQAEETGLFAHLQKDSLRYVKLLLENTKIIDEKPEAYQSADLVLADEEYSQFPISVTVKARGKSRKNICQIPPLKVKFPDYYLERNHLVRPAGLKLVTHCRDAEGYEQLLFKEYLAYKMYNLLTDYSFRVHLVRLEYEDADSLLYSPFRYGFFIEHKREMADRLSAKLIRKDGKALKKINGYHYRLFTVFQYMIGNTDWNLNRQHNLRLLLPEDGSGPIPVPYDFDFSGLVHAPYAAPYPGLGIEEVTERMFQFRGNKDADFEEIRDLFLAKKGEIMALCDSFELLDPSVREELLAYLDSFFRHIELPDVLLAKHFYDQKP